MKRFIPVVTTAVLLATTSLFAQDKMEAKKPEMKSQMLHGYVVDAMCAKNISKKGGDVMAKAAKHSRSCALEEECAASGFGLFSDGKWYKFDERGDKEAQALLQNTKTEKGVMVDVMGTVKDDQIMVASLTESTMSKDEMKDMKMEKKEMPKNSK